VCDRWFSPLFASDAAILLWQHILNGKGGEILEFGEPVRVSRYDIARMVNPKVEACRHESFPGLAPRPFDTTYINGRYLTKLSWESIHMEPNCWHGNDRAIELSLFTGRSIAWVKEKLSLGFGPLHNAVTEDFRKAQASADQEALLRWYRATDAYIWELTAYHLDPGFNYTGMVEGVARRLLGEFGEGGSVLTLGDGIGDATLAFYRARLDACYHDLAGSRTSEYARFRFWRQTGKHMKLSMGANWQPAALSSAHYHAIVAMDFMEHVPNVPEWVAAIYNALLPGGLFFAQNAFACGSGDEGAMPMHLAVNDRFERDWDPLLADVGFEQISSNWYRRPA